MTTSSSRSSEWIAVDERYRCEAAWPCVADAAHSDSRPRIQLKSSAYSSRARGGRVLGPLPAVIDLFLSLRAGRATEATADRPWGPNFGVH